MLVSVLVPHRLLKICQHGEALGFISAKAMQKIFEFFATLEAGQLAVEGVLRYRRAVGYYQSAGRNSVEDAAVGSAPVLGYEIGVVNDHAGTTINGGKLVVTYEALVIRGQRFHFVPASAV